ncbi:hypothetical protein [Nocardia transvalensis]|uniref:hypothetical protein n=1 Tax=Nocardia transvalensis TaxID=37333 RepID=UPI001894616D|nr:hypothetical protein [Nocardia transvalensis]MBF6328787.1 hypothetical protein [Nocardia transvalensis]
MAARSVPQPPFSTDLLADLHADNVPPDLSAQLWPQVREDPEALRFLSSLDDVTSELRALSNDPHVLHPMPSQVAARLDHLLDQLSGGDGQDDRVATVHHLPVAPPPDAGGNAPSTRPMPVVEPAEPAEPSAPISLDERRSRRLRWITAAAAAVAVIAGSLVAVDAVRGRDTPPPNALPTTETGAIPLDDDLSTGTILGAMGRNDVTGPLSRPGALNSCAAAAVPGRTVLGSMNVTFRGKPAVLILLTGPRPPKITAVVVGTGCSADDPQKITERDIG